MSAINDVIEITLNDKQYRARLDFGAIAEIQWNLEQIKENMTVVEIFNLAQNGNFKSISNIIIESIKRCHPQLKTENILEDMKLYEHQQIRNQTLRLFSASLPSSDDDKKKSQE